MKSNVKCPLKTFKPSFANERFLTLSKLNHDQFKHKFSNFGSKPQSAVIATQTCSWILCWCVLCSRTGAVWAAGIMVLGSEYARCCGRRGGSVQGSSLADSLQASGTCKGGIVKGVLSKSAFSTFEQFCVILRLVGGGGEVGN